MNRPNSQQQQKQPSQWDNPDNALLPDNTSENFGAQQQSYQMASSNQTLNGEQIDWLIKRLSTDDQAQLGKILRDCTTEMTLTRGLPFAAFTTGSLYFARSRLPESLRFGPKRWPFYAAIAVGSMTAANVLFMNNCAQRVKPVMFQLYQKYSTNQPGPNTTSYESLREANRQHSAKPLIPPYGSSSSPPNQMPDDQRSDTYPPRAKSNYLYEEAPTISGTPYSAGNPPNEFLPPNDGERRGRSGSNYGDKGFS